MTNKKHIGFDEAGMDAETSVKNIAYANSIVIASDTRSPDATGRTNTSGFNTANKSVGKIMITV
jgi:hypothetical protein